MALHSIQLGWNTRENLLCSEGTPANKKKMTPGQFHQQHQTISLII